MTDLSTQTPVEIDTQIAALYQVRYREQDHAAREWEYLKNSIRSALALRYSDKISPSEIRNWLSSFEEISEDDDMIAFAYEDTPWLANTAKQAWKHYLAYQDHAAKADEALADTEPLDDEWHRRGRWSRAYLVDNSNGHVHKNMHCSSCYPTTRYHWLVELADQSEDEIVDQAGERACTVCYPSAPVESLNKPTRTFTPTEIEKQKARDEKEAKRAEKAAQAVVVTGYYSWQRQPYTHTFKTERAALLALQSLYNDLCYYGPTHMTADRWTNDAAAIQFALREKGVEHDPEAMLEKARKKTRKDGVSPKL